MGLAAVFTFAVWWEKRAVCFHPVRGRSIASCAYRVINFPNFFTSIVP